MLEMTEWEIYISSRLRLKMRNPSQKARDVSLQVLTNTCEQCLGPGSCEGADCLLEQTETSIDQGGNDKIGKEECMDMALFQCVWLSISISSCLPYLSPSPQLPQQVRLAMPMKCNHMFMKNTIENLFSSVGSIFHVGVQRSLLIAEL